MKPRASVEFSRRFRHRRLDRARFGAGRIREVVSVRAAVRQAPYAGSRPLKEWYAGEELEHSSGPSSAINKVAIA